jgi:hypothetical protein
MHGRGSSKALVLASATVLALASAAPRTAQGQSGVVPSSVVPVTTPATIINNGPGDQFDPHISGDYVSYTSSVAGSTQIRYHNLATDSDQGIPNTVNGQVTADTLSDVSGSRVVFTRTTSAGRSIWLFDITTVSLTELDPSTNQRVERQSEITWLRGPRPTLRRRPTLSCTIS